MRVIHRCPSIYKILIVRCKEFARASNILPQKSENN